MTDVPNPYHQTLREVLDWRRGLTPTVSLHGAFEELRQHCLSGRVDAFGQIWNWAWHSWLDVRPKPRPHHQHIPPDDWLLLELVIDQEGRPTGGLNFIGTQVLAWDSVQVKWKDLFPLWMSAIAASVNPVKAVETGHLAPAPPNASARPSAAADTAPVGQVSVAAGEVDADIPAVTLPLSGLLNYCFLRFFRAALDL